MSLTKIPPFESEIAYSQFSVHKPWERSPFNIWSELHVKQCMAWREESVCFKTEQQCGEYRFLPSLHSKYDSDKISNTSICTEILCPIRTIEGKIEIETHFKSVVLNVENANMVHYVEVKRDKIWDINLIFFFEEKEYFQIKKCSFAPFSSDILTSAESAI